MNRYSRLRKKSAMFTSVPGYIAKSTFLFIMLLSYSNLSAQTDNGSLSSHSPSDFSTSKGRLHGTGGATQIEGAAGGGLVPWSVIAGYGSAGQTGATAFYTQVDMPDFSLKSAGFALGLYNRIELSIAQQQFYLGSLADALSLSNDVIKQDVFSFKVRLAGDLIYSRLPQLSIGVQYKKNRDFLVPGVAGALDDEGTDIYFSLSKLWLAGFMHRNLLTNVNLRSTQANQLGLVGFAGDNNSQRKWLAEGSLAVLLNRYVAAGIEYRQKPDNLSFAREDDWYDMFVAWFPDKTISLVAAYAQLGSIAGYDDQNAWYISLQGSF